MVTTNKNKEKPVSSWRCQRQAGSMKALQRAVWSFIFLVFGGAHGEDGGAGSSGAEEERKRPSSNSPSGHSMEEDTLL